MLYQQRLLKEVCPKCHNHRLAFFRKRNGKKRAWVECKCGFTEERTFTNSRLEVKNVVTIYKGKPSPDDWRRIGEMIDEGYVQGIGLPLGINWTVEVKDENTTNVSRDS